VTFDEPLDRASATTASNYSIDGGIEVFGAALGSDNQTVTLTTSPMAVDREYTLAVANVADLAGNPVAPGTSATFTFVQLPVAGLKLWLRADAGVVSSAGAVSTWRDQSGSGTDASQATAASQPLLVASAVNGRPALRFDGVNDFLTFGLPLEGSSAATLVLVSANSAARDGGANGVANAPLFWNETAPWGTVHLSPFQHVVKYRFGTGQSGNLPTYVRPASVGAAFTLALAQKDGGSEWLYLNGQLVHSALGKLPTLRGIRPVGNLGRGYNDNTYFPGEIAEVLVYTRALTGSERAQVEQYLRDKYLTVG
jgi:hypothetical protein